MGPSVWTCVRNIPSKVSDALMKELLSTCGPIDEWRRIQDVNKSTGFGLCRFSSPDAAMRALRILDEINLSGAKLEVTVDFKAKQTLEEYNLSNKTGLASDGKEAVDGDMGEVAKKLDSDARLELNRVVKLYEHELNEPDPDPSPKLQTEQQQQPPKNVKKEENLSDMELEDDKKNLIHREIGKFRDTYQRYEADSVNKSKDEVKNSASSSGSSNRRRIYHEDAHSRDRDSRDRESRDRDSRDRDLRDRDLRERDMRDRYNFTSRRSPYDRYSRRSPHDNRIDREKDRDRDIRRVQYERERDYKKGPFVSRRQETYEEIPRHPGEKKLAKEQSYQLLLREWKKREHNKARDYDLMKLREKERKIKEEIESKKLKEFLEDYNDDRDDIRYYKGSSLAKRLADRKKEIEADESSSRKEKQELELLSVKCASENNVLSNTSNTNNGRTNNSDNLSSGMRALQSNSNSVDHLNEDTNSNAYSINATFTDAAASTSTPLQLGLAASSSSTNSSTSGTSGNRVVTSEEKKKQFKEIIDDIPTNKEELFAYNIDWTLLEETLIVNRIRPWIGKKISEYIGEEEVSLIDFICTRLRARSDGPTLLRDVAVVLDDDAEGFVIKMWRLLIFEIELKRRGIRRSY